MTKALTVLAVCLFLAGCVSGAQQAQPVHLTDQQIAEANNAAVCSWSQTSIDSRLYEEIKKRQLDCSPAALVCNNQGYKRGSSTYSACITKYNEKVSLQQKRLANPDWAYCTDKGFKTGTEAMATCIASWQQQKNSTELRALQQQKALQDEQEDQWAIAACSQAAQHYALAGRNFSIDDCVQKKRYYRASPTAPPIYAPVQQQSRERANECGPLGIPPIARPGCHYACINGHWAEVC